MGSTQQPHGGGIWSDGSLLYNPYSKNPPSLIKKLITIKKGLITNDPSLDEGGLDGLTHLPMLIESGIDRTADT